MFAKGVGALAEYGSEAMRSRACFCAEHITCHDFCTVPSLDVFAVSGSKALLCWPAFMQPTSVLVEQTVAFAPHVCLSAEPHR